MIRLTTKLSLVATALVVGFLLPGQAGAAGTGSISGTVIDSAEQPVTEGCVRAYDLADTRVSFSWIGPDGSYRLEGLDTGDYKVEFERCDANVLWEYYDNARTSEAATPVSVTDGVDTSGINARLDVGGTISGFVTFEPGFPAPGICVYADKPGAAGYWSGSARVSPDGHYRIKGLETGDYKLEFRGCGDSDNVARQFYPGKATYSEAVPVSVTQGSETPGIDADLAPGGAVTGTVFPAESPAEVCAMSVKAYDSDGNLAGSFNSPGFLYTPLDYRIDQLITGNYRLHFEQGCLAIFSMDPFWVSEYFNNRNSLVEATPVSVTEGSTTSQISAVLGSESTISGTITDTEGAPLENICVEAANEDGPAGIIAYSDPDGHYSLNALLGGSYTLKFSDCQGTNERIVTPEYFDDKATIEEAVPVSVSAGGLRSGINARLATAPRPVPTAKISKLKVKGPAFVRKGREATFRLRITNSGDATATGVRIKGSGRGISARAPVGKIAASMTRTVRIRLRPSKAGKTMVTFRVTSSNAGGRTTKHKINVRKK